MDFYDPLPPTDSLSLQEMIECDMRTQLYDGQLSGGCDSDFLHELDFPDDDASSTMRGHCADRLHHPHYHLHHSLHHQHLDVSALDVKLDSDLNLVCDANLTWLSNGGHLSSSSTSSHGQRSMDFDPGSLLVNPKTGLPITLVSAQLRTSSGNSNDGDAAGLWKRLQQQQSAPAPQPPPTRGGRGSGKVLERRHIDVDLDDSDDDDDDVDIVDEPYVVNRVATKANRQRNRKRSTTATIMVSDSTDDDTDEDEEDEDDATESDDDEPKPVPRFYNGKAKLNTLGGTTSSKNGGANNGHGGKSGSAFGSNNADGAPFSRERSYPKPAYSYSCLIAMALKNSKAGSLPVSEIYSFMTENFPYFKTAPTGWKNSVRHNLSLNKCFEKIEKPSNSNQRKGCLWAMNPNKVEKMEEEVVKWGKKDPHAIKQSMARPEYFELLEKGCLKPRELVEPNQLPSALSALKKEVPEIKLLKNDNVKLVAKIKTEPATQDTIVLESNLYLDNSLLDLNVQGGLWEELDDKMDFDIPLSNDGLPSIQSCFASDVTEKNLVLGGGNDADKLSKSETMFFSKHIRSFSTPAMK